MYLAKELIQEIQDLHAKGKSYYYIGQAIGIHKDTVPKILKRPEDYVEETWRKTRKEELQSEYSKPHERCLECRNLVQMPCRICEARRKVQNKRLTMRIR